MLESVFDGVREELRDELSPEEYEQRRHDFAFHMTDWKEDLEGLAALFNCPDRANEAANSVFLIGFLYHVVPHLNAAARLLLDDIVDPFAPAHQAQANRKSVAEEHV